MDIAVFSEATGEFAQRLKQTTESQWTAATPCDGWDVRALVNHVVGELLWIPPLFEGKTTAEVGDRFGGDVVGGDASKTWNEAAEAALLAVSEPGAMERIVHLSFGDFPGGELSRTGDV